MKVGRFLLRRLALAVPILVGITLLTFMLVRIGEQDPVAMLAGPMASEESIAIITGNLGSTGRSGNSFSFISAIFYRAILVSHGRRVRLSWRK